MKSFILKLGFILSTIVLVTPFLPMANAQSIHNNDLMARVVLDPNMKPENSPGVIISEETLKQPNAETAFANYMLQVLAGGLITVAAPVAIIIIAVAGLFAVISHGDQKLIDRAKKTLTWAIIGLIVIIFSWVIVRTTIEVVLMTNNSPTSQSTTDSNSPPPPNGATTSQTN